MLPASTGMIGVMFPVRRKRTLAFVAVTCGKTAWLSRCMRSKADQVGGVSGATLGEIVAGALMEYNRYVTSSDQAIAKEELTQYRWTWRPCYLIIAVASIYPLVIIAWLVPLDPPFAESKKVDWIGSGLMCTSLFLLLFSFTLAQTESRGWQTPCESSHPFRAVPSRVAWWLKIRPARTYRLLRSRSGCIRPPTKTTYESFWST
jgi:MFS family permease